MKVTVFLRSSLMIAAAIMFAASIGLSQATPPKDTDGKDTAAKGKDEKKTNAKDAPKAAPLPAPSTADGDKATEAQTGDKYETQTGGDDPNPYYENYLKEYRLGPSDVISVEVFGQCPDYCITATTIPPNAKISYPLIREGILVAGKTVEQVAAEITKKLDEFIIDPKVTVTLNKAMATRYAVMGNVATPGVRVMDRKVSVYEAILESGGVTRNGNKDKVYVISYTKDGRLSRTLVSLTAMEMGKAEMIYLNPGDQVFVSGKGFTVEKFLTVIGQAGAARALFGAPF
jgi:polysaccharide biosynthesis/export protein